MTAWTTFSWSIQSITFYRSMSWTVAHCINAFANHYASMKPHPISPNTCWRWFKCGHCTKDFRTLQFWPSQNSVTPQICTANEKYLANDSSASCVLPTLLDLILIVYHLLIIKSRCVFSTFLPESYESLPRCSFHALGSLLAGSTCFSARSTQGTIIDQSF